MPVNAFHEGAQKPHSVTCDALCEEVSVIGLLHPLPRASGVTARRTTRTSGTPAQRLRDQGMQQPDHGNLHMRA